MKNSSQTLIAVAVMSALSAGNIAFVDSGIWLTGKAEEISIANMDAGTYQVESLYRLKDGSYAVTGSSAGFQSDVKLSVTFDSTGTYIEEVKVMSQAETPGLGTKIADADFTGRFSKIPAPVGITGKGIPLVTPSTTVPGANQVQGSQLQTASANVRHDPITWNSENQSTEAQAARALYHANLLSTAVDSQEMKTPYADMPAEEKAMVNLYRSGLLASAADKLPMEEIAARSSAAEDSVKKLYRSGLLASAVAGEAYTPVLADLSAENQAISKLEKVGLLVAKEPASAEENAVAAATEIDAVSGATVSSSAAVTVINNCYYFLKECVLSENDG